MLFKTGYYEPSVLTALLFATMVGFPAGAQKAAKTEHAQQTAFSSDVVPGEVSIEKPVDISDDALQILRNTKTVRLCIDAEDITPGDVSPSWFVGSRIELNGPNETDLIVLPRDLPDKPSANRCLYGAHAGPFWVLRRSGDKYQLLLETNADGLIVLDSRTNGYRDIEQRTISVSTVTSVTFRFDGEKYRPSAPQEKPAGSGP